MNLLADIHTHSIASGHAYSTITENIMAAYDKGLRVYGISDHGPCMPDTSTEGYFINLNTLPSMYKEMHILKGIEANILDAEGNIDLSHNVLERLDYVIASLHSICLNPMSKEENTRACINAMKNPVVKLLGHPDDGNFELDYERIVKAAKEYHVLIEINVISLQEQEYRYNSRDNCKVILLLCKEHEVDVIVNTDAHYHTRIGEFKEAIEVLEEMNFPKELVMNSNCEKLLAFLRE